MMSLLEPEQKNALKIAVLEEQIIGLREQQRAHNAATQKRFDGMEKKLDELTAIMNRGKGAYAASMALAAGVGAILIEIGNMANAMIHSK
ncbi:MAG: hypothetical protein SFW64_06915 [Alphaproteobacteria bacterium]|nr:hypothetical protein [Alphaproteobacteria bacterium]